MPPKISPEGRDNNREPENRPKSERDSVPQLQADQSTNRHNRQIPRPDPRRIPFLWAGPPGPVIVAPGWRPDQQRSRCCHGFAGVVVGLPETCNGVRMLQQRLFAFVLATMLISGGGVCESAIIVHTTDFIPDALRTQ